MLFGTLLNLFRAAAACYRALCKTVFGHSGGRRMMPMAGPVHIVSRGSGPPVLFIHGLPTSGRLWDGVIDDMSRRFTCLTLDLPGLGRTAPSRDGFHDLDRIADVLEDVRRRAIAVHYAHRFSRRTGHLALLSPSMFPDLKPFYLFELLRQPVLGELLAPLVNLLFWKIAMPLATGRRTDLTAVITDFRAPFGGFRGSWRLMSLMRWGNPAEVLASVPRLLPQLQTPALIFHGSKDPVVPEAFARRALNLLPGSEMVLLNSGHFLPLNEPHAVAFELLRFFTARKAAAV